ncbi:hypothetical protein F4677DRAFT_450111 [Hypoxylon crocopeplum]|nr:hypothetical protein F4677DRAFT_450111 [Hypoxylon crocopeplum]
MKLGSFASTVLFAAEAVVRATDCLNVALNEIPTCAQSCFFENASSVGCAGIDFACQCQNEGTLYAAIESCVASGCPEPSFQAVINGASSVCNCATAIPGALTVGNSVRSFTGVPLATDTVDGTVIGTIAGSITGTVVRNPTATSTANTAAAPSPSQGAAPSHQNYAAPGFAVGLAMAVIL